MPRFVKTLSLGLVAAFAAAPFACAYEGHSIDQRNPKYQIAIEHLANAANALAVAQAELKKANEAHPLPGLDVNRMIGTLSPAEETLRVILVPERKRLKYQTATPDGVFFTPTPIGE